MSNGVRPIKKMSQNQLTQALIELNGRFHSLSMAVTNDLQRVNVLLFTLLKEMGKVDEVVCSSCETINMRPLLKGIEVNPMCAECGTRIDALPEEAFKGEMIDDAEE
jgi:PHP family Zn ribbon phosphoesterase